MAHTALSKKTAANFPIWKTVTLGVHKNADEYHQALVNAWVNISPQANAILQNPAFAVSTTKMDVDLVVLSIADLGFKEGAKYSDICARARECGLEFCPAEVGLALRLAYRNQGYGERLIIATNAISDSVADLDAFAIGHGTVGLWLYDISGRPDFYSFPGDLFVFVRPT